MQNKIFQLIADQLNIKTEDIKMESAFIKDLKADSLDIVELVMNLEDHFNMQIPDEDAEKLVTVKDVIKYISSHTKSTKETDTSAKDDDVETKNK
ncbi:MAG: acyl carrier protein [Bdellovibrionales bacterium]|nr:acyl carrier protein [Bdellovibrionales bacterium]